MDFTIIAQHEQNYIYLFSYILPLVIDTYSFSNVFRSKASCLIFYSLRQYQYYIISII
jgi:hypothetical protein